MHNEASSSSRSSSGGDVTESAAADNETMTLDRDVSTAHRLVIYYTLDAAGCCCCRPGAAKWTDQPLPRQSHYDCCDPPIADDAARSIPAIWRRRRRIVTFPDVSRSRLPADISLALSFAIVVGEHSRVGRTGRTVAYLSSYLFASPNTGALVSTSCVVPAQRRRVTMLHVEYQLSPSSSPWRHRTMSLGAKPTTSSLQRRDSGYGIMPWSNV